MIDTLIAVIITLIIVGVVYYVVNLVLDMLPMDGRIRQIINVLLVIVLALIVISQLLPLIGGAHFHLLR